MLKAAVWWRRLWDGSLLKCFAHGSPGGTIYPAWFGKHCLMLDKWEKIDGYLAASPPRQQNRGFHSRAGGLSACSLRVFLCVCNAWLLSGWLWQRLPATVQRREQMVVCGAVIKCWLVGGGGSVASSTPTRPSVQGEGVAENEYTSHVNVFIVGTGLIVAHYDQKN